MQNEMVMNLDTIRIPERFTVKGADGKRYVRVEPLDSIEVKSADWWYRAKELLDSGLDDHLVAEQLRQEGFKTLRGNIVKESSVRAHKLYRNKKCKRSNIENCYTLNLH